MELTAQVESCTDLKGVAGVDILCDENGTDASISNLISPASNEVETGVTDFTVEITNNSPEDISSLTVHWSIDGEEQIPYELNDVIIPSGENLELNIGSYLFELEAAYDLAIWTSDPNGVTDSNPGNDYFYSSLFVDNGVDCDQFFFLEDVLCSGDNQNFMLMLTPFEEFSDEYLVENLLTGETMTVSSTPINIGPLPQGVGYSISISIPGEINCSYLAEQSMIDCTTTAVELIDFIGTDRPDGNYIEWEVASEYEIESYALEHSIDGLQFSDVAKKEVTQNTANRKGYNHLHNNPISGENYYRLSEITSDGKMEVVSKVIAIDNSEFQAANGNLSVYPNPAAHSFNLAITEEWKKNLEETENTILQVFDLSGKAIISDKWDPNTAIDCGAWAPGIYSIQVIGEHVNLSGKFLKVN